MKDKSKPKILFAFDAKKVSNKKNVLNLGQSLRQKSPKMKRFIGKTQKKSLF